jgi:DNA-binding winged helix-turn-helix (wHTH) protein/tetratricopeptide (TPR) repeat protein
MRRKDRTNEEIELDLGRYELRRSGQRVKLEKKPMELLLFLVSRRDQMVPREEIVAKLWRSDLFVDTERNINNIVRKIRTALRDDAEQPRFLETVVGKGYRFVGPVRVIDARYAKPEGELSVGPGERATLAVLPLRVVGNAADERGLSLGFADAVAARLGTLPGVDVLPAAAVLKVPADSVAAEMALRLGVRFVVHGAIQKLKGVWRLSVEMLDVHSQRVCFTKKCDLDESRLGELEGNIAKSVAGALNRPLATAAPQRHPRHSKDALAYAEFMRGYRLSSSGDAVSLEEATQHLVSAVTRDPSFSLAHATLSLVCATRHFEFDPTSTWLERAEFHCRRALEVDPDLAEGHVANAFLLWGPSKNFQHLEAIAELKRAVTLQKNLPHAYNRLGTILAHVGLLDRAREMYERGRPFHPQKVVSHSIVQVYIWNQEYDLAREEIAAWRSENPGNKYPVYFAPQLAMMTGDWKEAKTLLDEAARLLPEEPMIASLRGVFYALTGEPAAAMECMAQACASPKSFGHAHHTYYQIACILAVLGQREVAFEWLERSVSTGFACWPFFLKDACLENLRRLPEFEVLISSLQTRYPDHLGAL